MDERRTAHPFHMWDAINAQPAAFAEVVRRTLAEGRAAAEAIRTRGRLHLVGTGTSYHAALEGAHLFRVLAPKVKVQVHTSFDFVLYPPVLGPGMVVAVISHRGTKRYSVEALRHGRQAGCPTVLITRQEPSEARGFADHVVTTVPNERSSAHTVSYVGALAALLALAALAGEADPAPFAAAGEAALAAGLATEATMADLAGHHRGRRRIWLAGAGPDAVTAAEIALKIQETSYQTATGDAVESLIHGPFRAAEADDLVVLVAGAERGRERLAEFAQAVAAVGAALLAVGPAPLPPGEHVAVPDVPDPLSMLSCLVPLQLFAYHLALVRGTNPDTFRDDDPRFAAASRRLPL